MGGVNTSKQASKPTRNPHETDVMWNFRLFLWAHGPVKTLKQYKEWALAAAPGLSERQRKILHLTLDGEPSVKIAEKLLNLQTKQMGVTRQKVNQYVQQIVKHIEFWAKNQTIDTLEGALKNGY